jgi:hypothetical protein
LSPSIQQSRLKIFPVHLESIAGGVVMAALQAGDQPLMFKRHFLGRSIEALPLDKEQLDLAFKA